MGFNPMENKENRIKSGAFRSGEKLETLNLKQNFSQQKYQTKKQ